MLVEEIFLFIQKLENNLLPFPFLFFFSFFLFCFPFWTRPRSPWHVGPLRALTIGPQTQFGIQYQLFPLERFRLCSLISCLLSELLRSWRKLKRGNSWIDTLQTQTQQSWWRLYAKTAEVICQVSGGYMPRQQRLYATTAEVICQHIARLPFGPSARVWQTHNTILDNKENGSAPFS